MLELPGPALKKSSNGFEVSFPEMFIHCLIPPILIPIEVSIAVLADTIPE